ncbi:ABC transporter related protein [Coriobacterium glomerans PW2]|uniref:ABC transporter related protein n=1 Tax=Coriobacterium glomerans (strain ATCC 49209 / DSM 20642 / JCM 10262 / PW2) TaxID=700015 RepID=F2NBK8_CORGP|nr:ABC-F family ATP-binding cassette domain-containing protein [Coriobacterium glomerans]AEB06744.1 ABC transporter related protein [Coriobacterium glomerans PW2]
MAILLGGDSVSIEYPTKRVLDNVTLGVDEGDRIGIVGRNGDGKSTLLSLLAGTIRPDTGRVTRRSGIEIGLLGQTDSLCEQDTVRQAIVGELADYEWASRPSTRRILDGLTADVDWDDRICALSGGQRRRVDLARLLIASYDILMLDEPTNHLDMRTIGWLAAHLRNRWQDGRGALLIVTHDRWFLDEVCTSMWEVHDGRVDPFEGGYSAWVLARVERERLADQAEERRRNMARKELAWLSRGAQARSTKPKFRLDAAREIIGDVSPARDEIELRRLAVARLGKQVIDVLNATAGYTGGRPVLRGITWRIGAGDRYGLLGANGAGKSTLLSVIRGRLPVMSGSVRIGKTVRFGVLSQRLEELAPFEGDTVREMLGRTRGSYMVEGRQVSPEKLLERLGFSPEQMQSRIGELSGGQRRRLQLLLTLLDEPNVLILDEPGNDLDTDMLAAVEDLLDGWPGTLILVTHDRYLMERVTDHQFALEDGSLRHVPGGVDQYLRETVCASARTDRISDGAAATAPAARSGTAETEVPLKNSERQRLRRLASSLERRMSAQRERARALEREMTLLDPTDYQALESQQLRIAQSQALLDELETAWLEATERLEG